MRRTGHGLTTRRPYHAPHHTIWSAGLVGDGSPPRPREISLAHYGVFFLDDLSEFARRLLDALRQPPESGTVTIVRASGASEFPARALPVAAMNPCRCGWLGHPRRGCRCTPTDIAQHHARVSGPVLDRLDIQIEVPALTSRELQAASPGDTSAVVRARVLAARARQRERRCLNALLPPARLEECCALDQAGYRLVADAVDRGGMSARAVHCALRAARTIADLADEGYISVLALAEALQYRAYAPRFPRGPSQR